jgi:2-oxoglutarate dehydrogenase E2 component (dihydrolipoamide succinyltransferase)
MSKRDPAQDSPTPSPAARKLAEEHGLDPQHLQGTGEGGRLLQRDVMAALANLANDDEGDEHASTSLSWSSDQTAVAPPPQHAVERVDVSRLQGLLGRFGPAFEARHGLSLGLEPFVIKAVVGALAAVPDANVQLHEGRPQRNQYYDVAIVTPGPQGDRTPVLRSPQRKGFAEIQGELARFARQVHDGSLPAEAETGAVLTLHQRGAVLLGTVPLDPPQCLAMALHRVHDAPVIVPGPQGPGVGVRPICHVSLAWDPRALSATLADTLLARIKQGLEQPERLWLEV